MDKLKLLDLFCGAGGAARGYQMAGFHVTGIDNRPQPRYVGDVFIQADALNPPVRLEDFDVVHASPPCQAYTVANNIWQREHPDLLGKARKLLVEAGTAYVIENVPGAPMRSYVQLCGLTLGANVKRHRWFESNIPLWGTPCGSHAGDWLLVFGHTVLERGKTIGIAKGGGPRIRRRHVGTDRGREAMGISWMNRDELSEAVPPAYTQFIGEQILGRSVFVVADVAASSEVEKSEVP